MTATPLRTAPANPALAAAGASLVDRFGDPVDQARVALAWAHDTFAGNLVLASSMGDEVLVHLASEVVPEIDVLFIDTGYHFAETVGTAAAYEATRPIRLIAITPRRTVAEQDADEGPRLHDRDPDRCCALRKVEPLERGLARYAAWITGMRRVDAPTRTDVDVIGWDAKRGKVKVNPLAAWTDEDVAVYAEVNDVLLNPLRQEGYASIGCAPCTRAVSPGEDPRAGRWSGRAKTECGLHT
ncbi:MAG: phosphoadenylyl-sulfate reductase [Candidatus Nanopelagicales bacterium]